MTVKKRLFSYLKPLRASLIVAVIFALLFVIAQISQPFLLGKALDASKDNNPELFNIYVFIALGLAVLGVISAYIFEVIVMNSAQKAIKKAREYEGSHEKLIIVSGGCGSCYEELIKAGANFASSPKRINIHALDPAIIATKMSLSDINKNIDLKDILEQTKYGKDGIGGIITRGTMYVGYPR